MQNYLNVWTAESLFPILNISGMAVCVETVGIFGILNERTIKRNKEGFKMKLEIIYIFECDGGFKFRRETQEEIKAVFDTNLNLLKIDEKDGFITDLASYYHEDSTFGLFPSGSITFKCGGKFMQYVLKCDIKTL